MKKCSNTNHPPGACPICGGVDGCDWTGKYMGQEPLTVEEWKLVYYFIKYIELPFFHHIAHEAREREKAKRDPQNRYMSTLDLLRKRFV